MASTDGFPRDKKNVLRADARRNAELLREAAVQVFHDQGGDAPLEEIAKRAGVSIGTLYNRFGGRTGLLDAVASDLAQKRMLSILAQALSQTGEWERFATFVQGVCEFQVPDPGLKGTLYRHYSEAARQLAVSEAMISVGDELLQAAREVGVLRADFTRKDLCLVISAQGSLIRDQVDDATTWLGTVQFLLDGMRERR